MKKLFIGFIVGASLVGSALAQEENVFYVEKFYEAIKPDRMTECISDNKIYSVGMVIEKDNERFVCNKFKVDSDRQVSSESPASWRVKSALN